MSQEDTRTVVVEVKSDGDDIGLIADAYDYESGSVYATTAVEFADTGHQRVDGVDGIGKKTYEVDVPRVKTSDLELYPGERFSGGRYGLALRYKGDTLFEVEYPLEELGIELDE